MDGLTTPRGRSFQDRDPKLRSSLPTWGLRYLAAALREGGDFSDWEPEGAGALGAELLDESIVCGRLGDPALPEPVSHCQSSILPRCGN